MSQLPRSKVLDHYVDRYIRETGAKRHAWAQDVAEIYWGRVPLEHRTVQFHGGGDPERDARANRQLMDRMLDPDCVRFPADLEEAVVYSLPEPYRSELLADLAARYGLLAAAMPPAEGARSEDWCLSVARLMTEAGQSLEALAPVVADGAIDERDRLADLEEALRQQRDVHALSTEIMAALRQALERRRGQDKKLQVVS